MLPSLRLAIPLLLAGFTAVLGACVLIFLVPQVERAAESTVEEHLRESLTRLQVGLYHALLDGDLEGARREIAATGADRWQQFALAVDDAENVFAATRLEWVGQNLSSIDISLDSTLIRKMLANEAAHMITAQNGASVVGWASFSLNAEPGALRSSRRGVVVLQMDLDGARAAARSSVLQQAAVWTGLLAALSLVLWLLFHFILTRRVARLVDVAERIAQGHLDARSGLTGSDELARVGKAFDEMAAQLVENIAEQRVAEQRRAALEDDLRQAQRLESIGRLAGGVAHDFNNLLTVIMGHADLIVAGLSPDDEFFEDATGILQVSERAATLTRQLLAFSRKQPSRPETLDLDAVAMDTEGMLSRMIGEDVQLEMQLQAGASVRADRGHLEQVLVNLVVNAREAMPDGGRIQVSTHARTGWVILSVSDTGCGIDEATLESVFEPFYTTKPDGTGLGLATVYGIATQSGGRVRISSKLGSGTTVEVSLPRAGGSLRAARRAPTASASPGHESILLVEDAPEVRNLVQKILELNGYSVLSVADPEEALEWIADDTCRVDLLLTDVIMPVVNGPELAERCRSIRPDLKVLFMSGYSSDLIANRVGSTGTADVISKPFTSAALTRKVREVLDAPTGA